jgi:uncharacterized protein YjdB
VSSEGLVAAVSPGITQVRARSTADPSRFGTAEITVIGGTIVALEIAPPQLKLVRRATAGFTATPRNRSGSVVPGKTIAWSSDNPTIVSIDAEGQATGVAYGATNIRAAVAGIEATAPVEVVVGTLTRLALDPGSGTVIRGQSLQFEAAAFDSMDNPIEDVTIEWSSSDPGIATVSPAGAVTGVSAGVVTITARVGVLQQQATVTVRSPTLASVRITPRPSTLEEGSTVQLAATSFDENDAVVNATVVWTSTDPARATVNISGQVTAVRSHADAVHIVATATLGGITVADTLEVVIVQAPVATISLTFAKATVEIGEVIAAQAIVSDAHGNILSGRPLTWSSDSPTVAQVNSEGLVTGVSIGATTIRVASGAIAAAAPLTVVRQTVGSVTVTPSAVTLSIGQTQQLVATVKDRRGVVLTDRFVGWASSNFLIASVNSAGRVTAVSAGTATIQASSEGIFGTAQVTVTDPRSVTIDNVSLPSGATVPLEAYEGPYFTVTFTNRTPAPMYNIDIQKWISQGSARRAAGGALIYCGQGSGVLPPGTCVETEVAWASNLTAGTGTLVAGPAVLIVEVRTISGQVLDSRQVNVTLTLPGSAAVSR